jgi:hypothetical protein
VYWRHYTGFCAVGKRTDKPIIIGFPHRDFHVHDTQTPQALELFRSAGRKRYRTKASKGAAWQPRPRQGFLGEMGAQLCPNAPRCWAGRRRSGLGLLPIENGENAVDGC